MIAKVVNVFFYGLFMDESLLAAKNVYPVESKVGYVDGFRLHVGQRATLLPEPNYRAYGVVMKITPAEAETLYSEDSVADYIAEPVAVTLPGNVEIPAVCYNLPADKLTGTNPAYAAALSKLAASLHLPEPYVAQIRKYGDPT